MPFHRAAKQSWEIGSSNWLPDHYALTNDKGVFYKFVPHNGIERCADLASAMAW